ncbi:MAG: S8 family serine peptidase [Planctomycetaceae bacterium]|nr:S8 family serine peptidase [Planctomycetaceae bacterium]
MTNLTYYFAGKLVPFQVAPVQAAAEAVHPTGAGRRGAAPHGLTKSAAAKQASHAVAALSEPAEPLATRFHAINRQDVQIAPKFAPEVVVIPTETIILDGAPKAEIKRVRDKYGLELVAEGSHGKCLLRAPEGGVEGLKIAFEAARETYKRGECDAATPNFLRVQRRIKRSSPSAKPWNLHNTGSKGVYGADVHAEAAWTITKGSKDIRVAVLDEGVDTNHVALKPAVVAEKDFVDGHTHARPDNDDAHGTACAGIVLSRDTKVLSLGPGLSLVAVRIAKGDGGDGWIIDDFNTADAIDWAWDDAQADVLSNSWGGGPPVDGITLAFERARTQGRQGKGAVLVIAAGNDQGPITYPGTLPKVLTIGASNEWDERKTTTSQDGEDWWGSNFGEALSLLAPGVHIPTTDISGQRGYSTKNFTDTFNGTSSATPHVAAAAGLVLSVAPKLKEDVVRNLLTTTCDRLSGSKAWNKFEGHGRLNTYAALRAAMRA